MSRWSCERAEVPRLRQEVSVLMTMLPVILDAGEGDRAGRAGRAKKTTLISHLRADLVHIRRLECDDF